jgi:hypothetical protein
MQIPLGIERLKICELFAEFIHLQYLFTSSPLFDFMVSEVRDNDGIVIPNMAVNLIALTENLIKEGVMERCVVHHY